jgi:hypothetical protein
LLVNLYFRINFSPSGQCLFMFNWLWAVYVSVYGTYEGHLFCFLKPHGL